MNDDIKLLGMLLGYARRRMVAVLGQVEARLGRDAKAVGAAVGRLNAWVSSIWTARPYA